MGSSRGRSLVDLLATKEMVVVCGSGGTGKTTVAAALGAAAAEHIGGRVLVLTVDPARRLATALGLGDVGNTPVRVPSAALTPDCRGELWVAMLDTTCPDLPPCPREGCGWRSQNTKSPRRPRITTALRMHGRKLPIT